MENKTTKCSECEEEKSLSLFHKQGNICKICIKKYRDKRYQDRKEEFRENAREHYQENKDYIVAFKKERRKTHAKEISATRNTHYKKNKIDINRKAKARREADIDRIRKRDRKYRAENKESIKLQTEIYKKANKETIRKRRAEYGKNNRAKLNAECSKYRSFRLQRTVSWANLDKIKEVYLDCEEINIAAKLAGCTEKFVVDHIIPLKGKLVSGFHMEQNLQIITATENLRKLNKFTPGIIQ